MITLEYMHGSLSRGKLSWENARPGEGPQALGGTDPGQEPEDGLATTVVTTDAGQRLLAGWPHPDDVAEVSGADGPEIRDITARGALLRGSAVDSRYAGQILTARQREELGILTDEEHDELERMATDASSPEKSWDFTQRTECP